MHSQRTSWSFPTEVAVACLDECARIIGASPSLRPPTLMKTSRMKRRQRREPSPSVEHHLDKVHIHLSSTRLTQAQAVHQRLGCPDSTFHRKEQACRVIEELVLEEGVVTKGKWDEKSIVATDESCCQALSVRKASTTWGRRRPKAGQVSGARREGTRGSEVRCGRKLSKTLSTAIALVVVSWPWLHGRLQLRWRWHAWAIAQWPAVCILSYWRVWMAAWSGSRGVGSKHEFIGISIGGTGGIEMANTDWGSGRAEAPKDKAEMAAAGWGCWGCSGVGAGADAGASEGASAGASAGDGGSSTSPPCSEELEN
ncbi:hypothetical protein F5148DRAFT_1146859 [Russula earlei]|uniref:Uncharacterized protein n=1 Tax=Russula earlei TaxID=71964 RepID=A0ACC0UI45_9AGAM|nr:hypothetical protein F5148DRAFT_1146859 [Russula earlei]